MLSLFEKKHLKFEGIDPFPNNILLTVVGTSRQTINIESSLFEINTSSFFYFFISSSFRFRFFTLCETTVISSSCNIEVMLFSDIFLLLAKVK